MRHSKKYETEGHRRMARILSGMKQRCFNERNPSYRNYGARGIVVCERWRHSFDVFVADMGLPPTDKHSIDRIDNDGNYEPGNCRWATQYQQSMNRRDTVVVEWQGVTMTHHEWADMMGLKRASVYQMLWGSRYSLERVLEVHAAIEAGRENARRIAAFRMERKLVLGPLKGRTYRDVRCPICNARRREFNGEITTVCPWEDQHPQNSPISGGMTT